MKFHQSKAYLIISQLFLVIDYFIQSKGKNSFFDHLLANETMNACKNAETMGNSVVVWDKRKVDV